jgi:cobalt-zinc-cadmium efflux system outer membrane protein
VAWGGAGTLDFRRVRGVTPRALGENTHSIHSPKAFTTSAGLSTNGPVMPRYPAPRAGASFLLLVAGCSGRDHLRDERYLESELERRTGHAVSAVEPAAARPLPAGVSWDGGLTEEEAVAIALERNPAFRAALAEIGLARASLVQAGLLSNPNLNFLFPLGEKQYEFTIKLPVEVLWLRPLRVAAAELHLEMAAESLVQRGLDLARDVKVAFADTLLARQRSHLALEAADLSARIAALAEARLRAGDASELETTAARAETLLAREEAARLAGEALVGEEEMRVLLGLGSGDAPRPLPLVAPGDSGVPPAEEVLVQEAATERPDLRAAEIAVESAREKTALARWGVFQANAVIDANENRGGPLQIGPGIDLPVPIFDRGQGANAMAAAELERAVLYSAALRDRAGLEVVAARLRLMAAREEEERLRGGLLPELEEAVRRAQRAYELGEASLVLVLEATARLVKTRVRAAESGAARGRARAELERSVGRRVFDRDAGPGAGRGPEGPPP